MLISKYDSADPKLLDSIVCFADILGFSNLIKSALNYCYKELRELNPYGSIKTFTDNIILAYPKHEDGLPNKAKSNTAQISYSKCSGYMGGKVSFLPREIS